MPCLTFIIYNLAKSVAYIRVGYPLSLQLHVVFDDIIHNYMIIWRGMVWDKDKIMEQIDLFWGCEHVRTTAGATP